MGFALGGGHIGPVAAAGGGNTGLIGKGKGLILPLADVPVDFGRGGRQPPEEPGTGMAHRKGGPGKAPVPCFQKRLHHGGVAAFLHIGDEGIALQKDAAHRRQRCRISRHHLADRPIQKRPPLGRPLLNERQLTGGEHHRQKFPGQFTRRTFHPGKPRQLFAAEGQRRGFFPVLAGEFRLDAGHPGAEAQVVALLGRPEALLSGQQVDGLDEVGFPLGVFAVYHIDAGAGHKVHRRQVPEVFGFQPAQLHGAATCQLSPSSVTVSPGCSFLPRMVQGSPFTCTSPSAMAVFASPPVPTAPQYLRKLSSLINSV